MSSAVALVQTVLFNKRRGPPVMGCSGYTQLIKGVPIRGFSSATFNSGGSSVIANSRGVLFLLLSLVVT